MDGMVARAHVTNQTVADELGVTHAHVSRIRSGDRFPSVGLMKTIAHKFGWPLEQQAALFGSAQYAVKFEDVLIRRYDVGVITVVEATSS